LGCDPESLPYLKRLTTYDSKQTTPSPEAQDAEYLFARIRMSIIDLVSAVASESCLIVLIEDIHWMDEWSWDVMSALTKKLGKTGMLILMTRRDSDEQATPMPKDAVIRGMPLAPLDESRCRKLLGLVGPAKRVVEEDFVEWCVKTSAGNPYFLIELGRRASKTDGRFQAPPSLTRLISERFLEVAPLSRRVLQAAAVLGKNSTLARIEEVLAEPRLGLLDSLDELATHALIVSDDQQLVCRHDLLGISALSEISPLALRLLHRHAAMALESEVDRDSQQLWLWDAAQHWEASGDSVHAIGLLDRIAVRAIVAGKPLEATRALEHALRLQPEGEYLDELAARLVHALYLSKEYPRLVEVVEARRSTVPESTPNEAIHSLEELYEMDARLFARGPSIELLERCLGCVTQSKASPDHRVHSGLIGIKAAQLLCLRRPAQQINSSLRDVLPLAKPAIRCEFLVVFEGSFGSVAESAAQGRDLLAMYFKREHLALRLRAIHQCAVALYLNGEVEASKTLVQESLDLSTRQQMPAFVQLSARMLLSHAIARGDLDGAGQATALLAAIETRKAGIYDRSHHRDVARLALLREDVAEAKRIIGPFDSIWAGDFPIEQQAITEVRTQFRLLEGAWIPSDAEMDRLMRMHRRGRRFGGHDMFIKVLVEAHAVRRELDRVGPLVQYYVTGCRRERGPLMHQLRETLERYSIPVPEFTGR
jgi:hypothetical protein